MMIEAILSGFALIASLISEIALFSSSMMLSKLSSIGNVIFGLVILGQSNFGKYITLRLSGESVKDIV